MRISIVDNKFSLGVYVLFVALVVIVFGCKSDDNYAFNIDKAPIVIKFTIPVNNLVGSRPSDVERTAIVHKLGTQFGDIDSLSLTHFFKIDSSLFYGEYYANSGRGNLYFFVVGSLTQIDAYRFLGPLSNETRIRAAGGSIYAYKKRDNATLEIQFDLLQHKAYLTRDDGYTLW